MRPLRPSPFGTTQAAQVLAAGLMGLASALAQTQAVAQTPAPAPAQHPAPPVCQQLLEQPPPDQRLDHWLDSVPQCQYRPDWLARLGHLLNQQARYKEAADHLERAVLLDPESIDAQIDYAIALAGTGDRLSALNLIANVLATDGLPDPLRQALQQQSDSLSQARARQAGQRWQTRYQLGAMLGRDSNLLGAPNLTGLTLTLGDTLQFLPLESGYLAQPGTYQRLEALVHARGRPNDGAHWDLLANLRQRSSAGVSQANSDQYELLAERHTIGLEGGHPSGSYARASTVGLQTRLSGRYQLQSLAAGWGHANAWGPWGQACQARTGLEWQSRRFQDNPILSGLYRGLAIHWQCQTRENTVGPWQQWQASLRSGQDSPRDPARAGGEQNQTAVHLQWTVSASLLSPGAAGIWRIDTEWVNVHDRQPYSVWLENGARRQVAKTTTRLEYQRALPWRGMAAHWHAYAGYEYLSNQANLPLFNMRSQGPYMGARASW